MFVLIVFPARKRVLIDTWWNVNFSWSVSKVDALRVLIDTWWNVNVSAQYKKVDRSRFNRYMVECE